MRRIAFLALAGLLAVASPAAARLATTPVDQPNVQVHLVAERDTVAPGDELVISDLAGLRVGFLTCYDIRFPELSRSLAADGAPLLTVSAAWQAGLFKEEHWVTLLRARAIENTVWIAAAGQVHPHEERLRFQLHRVHDQTTARLGYGIVSQSPNTLLLEANLFSGNGGSDSTPWGATAGVGTGNGYNITLLDKIVFVTVPIIE